ncbi:MAG: PEP-CTERM sorting domain-containing protein [Luteolibacter sp.]
MSSKTLGLICVISAPILSAQDIAVLDFAFAHGTVISNQYSSNGVLISVDGGQDIGIVYDSELGGPNSNIDGADTDLERRSSAGDPLDWDGGNLGANYNAGGLLIIQENGALSSAPTYGSGADLITSASNYDPDDNGGGGVITFDLDENNFTYNYFNVTLADFEEDGNNYSSTLYGVNGTIETFSFADFTNPSHARYDSSITNGDNHINALPEIVLSTGEALSMVEITFNNSSGSVSNIIFSENPVPVPEPGTMVMVGLGALVAVGRRRRG